MVQSNVNASATDLAGIKPGSISIVITCYNHANYLGEAIESALNQDYQFCNVIIIDDGSTDHSKEVALSYPAAKYHYQENQGLSVARNAGIKLSNDEFILFLDADDRLTEECCSRGVECMVDHPDCAFVYGAHRTMDVSGNIINNYKYEEFKDNHGMEILKKNFIGMHAVVLYRKSIIRDIGGFDQNLDCCEDYDLYIRLTRSRKIASHQNLCAEYRILENSMSSDYIRMLKTIFDIFKALNVYSKAESTVKNATVKGKHNWFGYYAEKLLINNGISSRERLTNGLALLTNYPAHTVKFVYLYAKNKNANKKCG